jgi:signal transduction histidine kinase
VRHEIRGRRRAAATAAPIPVAGAVTNAVPTGPGLPRRWPPLPAPAVVLLGLVEIAVVTAAVWPLDAVVPAFALSGLYFLPVLHLAGAWGFWPAFVVATIGTLTFDFFFLEPRFALGVNDSSSLTLLGVLLVVAYVVSALAGNARRRTLEAERLAVELGTAERRIRRIAEEQTSLGRVATLVAEGATPADTFTTVATEVGQLFAADVAVVFRYEPDRTGSVVGLWSVPEVSFPAGARLAVAGAGGAATVLDEGRPNRTDRFEGPPGSIAGSLEEMGAQSGVAAPIVVEGRLWGAMVAATIRAEGLPPGSETRLADFTDLAATAIANAESQEQLIASRARIVAAADHTRRRIERDLHDGAQQRLVSLALELRAAKADVPAGAPELVERLDHVAEQLVEALDELREIARGIHPAVLAQNGLRPALKTLARRSPVPVRLEVDVEGRLPEHLEVAAYYVVSEALTNAAKHAAASVVDVEVTAAGGLLKVRILDDGRGGARIGDGSGLVGLYDRVEALGGRLRLGSPPGGGTTLEAELPLGGDRAMAG